MTTSTVIGNVSLRIDDKVVKDRGTFLVETTDVGTVITDQETGHTWNVIRSGSIDHLSFFIDIDGEQRVLKLGDDPKADCGCGKRAGMI